MSCQTSDHRPPTTDLSVEPQARHLVRVNARRCPLCRPYFSAGFVCGFVVATVGLLLAANFIWR